MSDEVDSNGVPTPFARKWRERTDSSTTHGDECVLCGRRTGGKKNTLFGIVVSGGGRFALLDSPEASDDRDPGFMGAFPVGSECAKVFPPGYLSKEV